MMTIEFERIDWHQTRVLFLGGFIGFLETQHDGSVIYNCHAEINYSQEYLEQILAKMKELQSIDCNTSEERK